MNTKKVVILLAGVVAAVGQFYGANFYLPLIGGAVAVIVGFTLD